MKTIAEKLKATGARIVLHKKSMTMIEVFKTNVETTGDAHHIVQMLLHQFPGRRINFDLQDCDKILRVEGKDFCTETIIVLMKQKGFHCSILE